MNLKIPAYRLLCATLLALLCLMPVTTLIYRDELGNWAKNRTCMAAPDEPSYLLMAQALSHDGTINISGIAGHDTFYPPAWPAAMALLTYPFGLSRFTAHLAAAILLSISIYQVYRLALFMLKKQITDNPINNGMRVSVFALLITAVYATNWHVLDGSTFAFSEPGFTVALLAWLIVGMHHPDWPASKKWTFVLALLALLACAMRSAGMVCVASMLIYAGAYWLRRHELKKLILSVAVILALTIAYFGLMHVLSPERSLAAAASTDNSYSKQLLNGLTDHHYQQEGFKALLDLRRVGRNLVIAVYEHGSSWAESFAPPIRETPRFGPFTVIGRMMLLMALFGGIISIRKYPLACLLVGVYAALYLLWPFDMIRFWAPILPLMLVFIIRAIADRIGTQRINGSYRMACMLLLILLALYLQELRIKQPYWLQRLNYVSDTFALTAEAIKKDSGDSVPYLITPGRDEAFSYAWYMNEPHPAGEVPLAYPLLPPPHTPKGGQSLAQCVMNSNANTMYVVSYFTHPDIAAALAELDPKEFRVRLITQREIIAAAWRVERVHPLAMTPVDDQP